MLDTATIGGVDGVRALPAPWMNRRGRQRRRWVMTHKYRGSIVVLSISKSVEPNEEQREMITGFQ